MSSGQGILTIQSSIVEEDAQSGESAAQAEGNHKRRGDINNDALLVGFARFAIVFRSAVLTFDVREQVGTQRAAPPGKVDLLSVVLATVGAGGILSCVLHNSSGE